MTTFKNLIVLITLLNFCVSQASINSYCREIIESKGRILIFEPSTKTKIEESQIKDGWNGFFKKHDLDGRKVYFSEGLFQAPIIMATDLFLEKPISIHPFAALNRSIVVPATEYLTESITGNRYRFSRIVNFAGSLVAYSLVIAGGLGLIQNQIHHKSLVDAQKNREALFDFASYDFRGRLYFPGITREDLANDQILYSVWGLRKAYDDYFSERLKLTQASREHFQFHLVMMSVQNFFIHDLGPIPGFYVPENARGPISNEIKDRIFEIEDQLLADFELSYLLVGLTPMTTMARRLTESDLAKVRLAELKSDNFIRKIIRTSEHGAVLKKTALYWIQNYLYWQRSFKIWSQLKIGKYKLNEVNGVLSQTPQILTIEDIKNEIMDSLERNDHFVTSGKSKSVTLVTR